MGSSARSHSSTASSVVDLRSTAPQPEALAKLDGAVARELRALPLEVDETHLTVATDHIPTPAALARLASESGLKVSWMLAPPVELARSIDISYRVLEDVDVYVKAFETGEAAARQRLRRPRVTVDEDAPVVQVVSRLLTEAVRERASDVHIEPTGDGVRVRFRVDGALHEPIRLPASMAQALVSRVKIMADMNIVERRRSQDGQFEFNADGVALDVRVATAATIWGEKVVMRILDRSRSLLELPSLGMPADTVEEFTRLVKSPFGMVICAGPTGSGKTTTLYAALNEINDPERNITTIEDPVEYVFPSINQIQINEQADITFAGGLKAILRQDPDVILVGEIRDVETARIAVQSALTGHLVLSSLHATDAASALQRFLDMGIESFLIASSVVAIIGQRLLRRICTHCAEELRAIAGRAGVLRGLLRPEQGLVRARRRLQHLQPHGLHRAHRRLRAATIITDEIRELIVQHAPHEKIHAIAVAQGMRTLRDEAIHLVEQDVTSIGEVIRRIYVV